MAGPWAERTITAICPGVSHHPKHDRSHRDASAGQTHRPCLLVGAEARSAGRYAPEAQIREHCVAVDALPLGECLDAHVGQVVADERVHIGCGEKGRGGLDSPRDRASIALRIAALGTVRYLVDPRFRRMTRVFALGMEFPNVLPRHPARNQVW